MKRLAAFALLLPGAALAHGSHAPVTGIAHDAAHAAPLFWLLALGGLLAGLWLWRIRS